SGIGHGRSSRCWAGDWACACMASPCSCWEPAAACASGWCSRSASGCSGATAARKAAGMKIDRIAKLQHLLQVLAFCLAIAAIQYAFQPERPYGPPVVYSLFIGTFTWAFIDLGRDLFPSSGETGWPRGIAGLSLVVGGIVGGYLLGNLVGDKLCLLFGFYPPGPAPDRDAQLRSSILITAMAGIAASYYFYSTNKSAYLERKMSEARRHANEARLKLLETQLEPHMLFNTLANL